MQRDSYVDLAEAMIVADEGLQLFPYKCTAGKLSIGIGRNLEDVGISKTEARFMFRNDMTGAVQDLWLDIPCFNQLSDVRKAVLLNMRFNLGRQGLRLFKKMHTALNCGDYESAAKEMLDSRWARQVPARAARLADLMKEG